MKAVRGRLGGWSTGHTKENGLGHFLEPPLRESLAGSGSVLVTLSCPEVLGTLYTASKISKHYVDQGCFSQGIG